MTSKELPFLTLSKLSQLIAEKKVSPVEVNEAVLQRIQEIDGRLKSLITVPQEKVMKAARAAEKAIIASDYRGPLHGVPLSLKDLCATAGVRTTAGAKILSDWVPREDSTVAARLKEAGAVLVGKANMHEFAYGATTDNPYYGRCCNPWDLGRIPGGSSGGSGAAVATSLCYGSIGSDTGGSIRLPASLCGVVGLKPTYGRVSRYGVVSLSWTQDHLGPMTKTAEDAAMLLQAIAGHDPKDATTSEKTVPDYVKEMRGDIKGIRLGLIRDFSLAGCDEEVLKLVKAAIGVLEGLGASVEEVEVPHIGYGAIVQWITVLSEAAAYHRAYFPQRSDEYGSDVRILLELGNLISAADYLDAQRVRQLLREDFRRALSQVDVLVSPCTPVPAAKHGQNTVWIGGVEQNLLHSYILYMSTINPVGLPAISVPCGFTAEGLPTAMQIVGRPFDESTLLRVAHNYESQTNWAERRPPI